MRTETYRFKVGTFECMAVTDGTHTYAPPAFPPPATFLFPNAPREQLAQALCEHNIQLEQWAAFTSPYICMLVDTGEYRVLLDTGADPIHLEQPTWYFAVDLVPEQALASRRRLLERAVAEQCLVQAFHFPFPGLGHVIQRGDAWQWQPIEGAD